MDHSLKTVAWGCRHAPLTDPVAVDWLLDLIRREKPDLVVDLGDGLEANAASKWDDAKEMDIELEAEFKADNDFLASVRKIVPKARKVRLASNHEGNLLAPGRIDKRVRSLCDWRSPKNIPEIAHWEVMPEYVFCKQRGCWHMGQVTFSHGYETSKGRIPREAVYMTQGHNHGLYLSAHTHRPHKIQQVMFGDLPLNVHYGNVGCLRDMDPEYMKRNAKWNWGQGAFVGEIMPLKSPRMSKEWDGEVRIFRMFDDSIAA